MKNTVSAHTLKCYSSVTVMKNTNFNVYSGVSVLKKYPSKRFFETAHGKIK